LHTWSGAQHHNLMADKYVDAMADVLQDIHRLLGYQAFRDDMDYPGGYPSGIPREFYEALPLILLSMTDQVMGQIKQPTNNSTKRFQSNYVRVENPEDTVHVIFNTH
jgi:hypothetical protein